MSNSKLNWRQRFNAFDRLVLAGAAINLIVIVSLVVYWILH